MIPENSFQHLSRCIEINRRSLTGHLSRCIEIYRFPKCSLATSTRPSVGRNSAKKVPASNCLTCCYDVLFRHYFYRHGAFPEAPMARKTLKTAVIKWPNFLSQKEFSINFLPSDHSEWRIDGRSQSGHWPQAQANTLSPCFSTTASNLSAMPLGRLVPASHFCTVDSLVFR